MKAHLAKVSLALLSTVFLLGCQEQGSGPVGPEGPQFDKPDPTTGLHDHGDDGGGGKQFVFVDVVLDGWMITDPVDQENQMELARKPGIMKIRANTEKAGTPFLNFAINMGNTLAALTVGSTPVIRRNSLNTNCEWSGRIEQTEDNENWVIGRLPFILTDLLDERSVLVVIDESAFVQQEDGTFVSVSEDNAMGIWPTTVGTWPGFRVKGSPTVTVVGDPTGDDFTATFSEGKVKLTVAPPEDSRNVIHLSCNISDDITFEVMSQGG